MNLLESPTLPAFVLGFIAGAGLIAWLSEIPRIFTRAEKASQRGNN